MLANASYFLAVPAVTSCVLAVSYRASQSTTDFVDRFSKQFIRSVVCNCFLNGSMKVIELKKSTWRPVPQCWQAKGRETVGAEMESFQLHLPMVTNIM